MKRSWFWRTALSGVGMLALAVGAVAFAQVAVDPAAPQDARRRRERLDERPQGRVDRADHPNATTHQLGNGVIAQLLVIGNQKEVAVNRLAVARAENPEVKQFAEQMVKAHGQFVQRLAPFASTKGRDESPQNGSSGDAKGEVTNLPDGQRAATSGDREPADPGRRESLAGHDDHPQGPNTSPLLTFDRELAERCLQSTERFLDKQKGADFDRWFMTLQLVEHMGMRDTLLVAQKHVSGDFKNVIDEALQTTDQHLRHAEQIMAQLSTGKATERTSAPPASGQQ